LFRATLRRRYVATFRCGRGAAQRGVDTTLRRSVAGGGSRNVASQRKRIRFCVAFEIHQAHERIGFCAAKRRLGFTPGTRNTPLSFRVYTKLDNRLALVRCDVPWRRCVATLRCDAPLRRSVATLRCDASWRHSVATLRGDAPWRRSVATLRGDAPL